MKNNIYDVIVVGGGHAGIEASLACARMGCRTLLVTLHKNTIGLLSCNPAFGGVGKGQLIKEIDALGGEIAKAVDACAIQYRTLNASKGPAVWSGRAQVDMKRYSEYMQRVVSGQNNLFIYEGKAEDIIVENGFIRGVKTDKGDTINAKAVVITPGTFLNGLIHIGMKSFPGGRLEETETSEGLALSLRNNGFRLFRFKTGTCARLDGKTIDFSKTKIQHGDNPPRPFSFSTKSVNSRQVPCYITYTTKYTHDIITNNLDRSPLYSGKITGTGVRYCPSLEDKVVKFAHHDRHQIFLEPEGLDTDEYYPNGLSTSLPEDVQDAFIRSVPGLENVKINRYGYGIEHDIVDPTELYPTMETKRIRNLFLAGQINGTTGYEEAGAQGLLAGINAGLRVKGAEPVILNRSGSYIGVLLDDLTTKGTNEPYRMFTSRVEYRMALREDNADLRLCETGYKAGLVSIDDYKKTKQKEENIKIGIDYLRKNRIKSEKKAVTLEEYLRRPEVTMKSLKESGLFGIDIPFDASRQIEIEVKYCGYIEKELKRINKFKDIEKIKIPQDMDYSKIHGLSLEIIQKLSKIKPLSLGQASRISGVTPSAISILMVWLKKTGTGKKVGTVPTFLKKSRDCPYFFPCPCFSRFSDYLRQRFGCRVYKVTVDAGFSCPNMDGKINTGGCVYCDNRGFSLNARVLGRPIREQIEEGMNFGRERMKAEKFICYFQAYTNTYASKDILKERYDIIKEYPDIIGLSIGTRPDCIDEDILDMIEVYTKDYDVWIEYGLQSVHDKTLDRINRGHQYQDFLKVVELTRKRENIKICAHVIIGLPGETREDMIETAKELGRLKIDGIKIHPLHVIKGTVLEKQDISLLSLDEYVETAVDFLEHLWPRTVIQRITAECPKEMLAGPEWILDKNRVLNEIEYKMKNENRCQGRLWPEKKD